MTGPGKIAVVLGAKGGTGSQIVARLAELDVDLSEIIEIRAVVRDASSKVDKMIFQKHLSNSMFHSHLENVKIMEGDITKDDGRLRDIFRNAGYVYNAASGKGNEETIKNVDRESIILTLKVINEVASHTIERYVLVTSMFVHPSNKYHPVRMLLNTFATGLFSHRGIMDYKWDAEQILRSQPQVPHTIIRPSHLIDGPLNSSGQILVGQTNKSLKEYGQSGRGICRADLSNICVMASLTLKTRNTTFEVATRSWKDGEEMTSPIEDDLFHNLDTNFMSPEEQGQWRSDYISDHSGHGEHH